MSVLGTGIAAAVAQTAQQAEQVARRRDKRQREIREASERTREIFETHLKVLEENDDTETTARLQVETNLGHENTLSAATSKATYDKPQHAIAHPVIDPPSQPEDDSAAGPEAGDVSANANSTQMGQPQQAYQQQKKQPEKISDKQERPSLDVQA